MGAARDASGCYQMSFFCHVLSPSLIVVCMFALGCGVICILRRKHLLNKTITSVSIEEMLDCQQESLSLLHYKIHISRTNGKLRIVEKRGLFSQVSKTVFSLWVSFLSLWGGGKCLCNLVLDCKWGLWKFQLVRSIIALCCFLVAFLWAQSRLLPKQISIDNHKKRFSTRFSFFRVHFSLRKGFIVLISPRCLFCQSESGANLWKITMYLRRYGGWFAWPIMSVECVCSEETIMQLCRFISEKLHLLGFPKIKVTSPGPGTKMGLE